jgi:hypothetical protein
MKVLSPSPGIRELRRNVPKRSPVKRHFSFETMKFSRRAARGRRPTIGGAVPKTACPSPLQMQAMIN